ncbi:MAG: hypothetical protein L6437_12035 [Kiritimatiellae bacterium]|nr:hypothetical protein [Kiritimatiellia bacterium]
MKPDVLNVEIPMFSKQFMFAGCPDLICKIEGHECVTDYKSALTDLVFIQLGGYALLDKTITHGIGVELREDGKYRTTGIVRVDRFKQEFLACLSVFNIRKRLGLIIKEDADGE